MAVKTLYIVTGKDDEEKMRTEDKKYADWYDKRLDCSEQILSLLKIVGKDFVENISEKDMDALCVTLSMNGDKLAKVLKGKEAEAVIETDGLDEYTSK